MQSGKHGNQRVLSMAEHDKNGSSIGAVSTCIDFKGGRKGVEIEVNGFEDREGFEGI